MAEAELRHHMAARSGIGARACTRLCTPIRSACSDPHDSPEGRVIRAFLAGRTQGRSFAPRRTRRLWRRSSTPTKAGCSKGLVAEPSPYLLRIHWPQAVQETEDPYSFGLLLGDIDLFLFNEGRHFELGKTFGAQTMNDRWRQRRAVCGLGAECRARRCRRRFQFMGSPPAPDAAAAQRRGLGTARAAGRTGLALQIRYRWPGRRAGAAESRSGRSPDRNSAQHRVDRRRSPTITSGATKPGCNRAASGRRRTRRFRSTRFISDHG